jgi:predicted unusual protein kinase regulating ubiquinone biosynthesis (AarF/ABC1/UbiB family)
MIFIDGIYHADPHPGNVMVQNDGKIILIDFGAVGMLDQGTRSGLGSVLESIIKGDEEQLLRSLKQMGFLRIGSNHSEAASRVIEHFHRKFQEEIKVTDFSFSSIQIDAGKGFEHLADLKGMNVGIRELASAFHVPREWVLLERMVLQLTGICSTLDMNLNPANIVRPYLEEFVLGDERDWSQMMFDLSREKVISFLSLPKLFDKFITRALSGQLQVRFETRQSGLNLIYLGVQQLAFSFLAGTGALIAVYFDYSGQKELVRYAMSGSGFFIALMLISMMRSGKFKS